MKISFFLYLLTSMVIFVGSKADIEPKCSKFDFEEKLLEKMVRMEHQNILMMEEFVKISERVKGDLDTMKEESEERKRQEIENQEKSKALIDEYIRRPSYAFNVNWLGDINPASGEALKFSRIRLNEGNAYNQNTGKYTAQVNGSYIFTTTLCFQPGQYAHMQFIAEDTVIGSFLAGNHNGKGYHCTSSSVIVLLRKGTDFWLNMAGTTSGTTFFNRENYYESNLAGHLIEGEY